MDPIAIIGRACLLPGATSPEELWDAVSSGRDLLGTVPEGRWGLDARDALVDGSSLADRAANERGGYVRGFDEVFEPTGFAVPAADLAGLDRVFLWTLHTARAALVDAGVPGDSSVGAIYGNLGFPSQKMAEFAAERWRGEKTTDARNRYMAGGVASLLREALSLGDAYSLDAACASSLYAIKLACDELNDGRRDVMLAGAVQAADDLFLHVGFTALTALSASGQSRPFHRDADGLVPGEGAGFVVLKRLADARRDGDQIHGVIRGVGLSNDGRGRGILAPLADGQERAIRAAYREADVAPSDVSLLECHATGTRVGDATELRSSAAVFGGGSELTIGSLKSNMGHLITAAGVGGLIKVLEAMRNRSKPPSLHCESLTDALAETPFRVLRELEYWMQPEGPRIAGVSAFGFGGNNAHLVVSEEHASVLATPTSTAGAGRPVAVIGCAVSRDPDQVAVPIRGVKFPPVDLKASLPQQLELLRMAMSELGEVRFPADRSGVFVGVEPDVEVARYGARWRLATQAREEKWSASDLASARDNVVPALTSAAVIGTMPNIPANRLSSQFDVQGPAFTLSHGVRSGVTALNVALDAINHGELEAALVGAVDFAGDALNEEAAGAPQGDLAVLVILKEREAAEADGDTILAVISRAVVPEAAAAASPGNAARGLVEVAEQILGVAGARRGKEPWLPTGEAREISAHGFLVGESFESVGTPLSPERLHVYRAASPEDLLTRLESEVAGGDGPVCAAIVCPPKDLPEFTKSAVEVVSGTRASARGVHYRPAPLGGEVAVVFGGAGTAYAEMGKSEMLAWPEALNRAGRRSKRLGRALDACWKNDGDLSVLDRLWGASAVAQTHWDLITNVAAVKPEAVIGYSSGEANSLVATGIWSDVDGLVEESEASHLFDQRIAGEFQDVAAHWSVEQVEWETYAVIGPVAETVRAIEDLEHVRLTIINSDKNCIIAGESKQVAVARKRLGETRTIRVPYDLAVHVPELRLVEDEWVALHTRKTQPQDLRVYSNGFGGAYEPTESSCAEAIRLQAVDTLDFRPTVRAAFADGVRVFVECGPQGSATSAIREILAGEDIVAVALDASKGGYTSMLHAAAVLVCAGVPVDLDELRRLSGERVAPAGPFVTVPARSPAPTLPRYPMDSGEESPSSPVPAPVQTHTSEVRAQTPLVQAPPVPVRPLSSPAVSIESSVPKLMPPAPPLPPVRATIDLALLAPRPEASATAAPAVQREPQVPREVAPPTVEHRVAGTPHSAFLDEISRLQSEHIAQQTALHTQYLAFQAESVRVLAEAVGGTGGVPAFGAVPALPYAVSAVATSSADEAPSSAQRPTAPPSTDHRQSAVPEAVLPHGSIVAASSEPEFPGLRMSREDLMVHASGKISEVFGPKFVGQDEFERQVRMPEGRLLLADRVIGLDAEPASMGRGTIWTETDVEWESWYLNRGYMPAGILIESGQADLVLISYLGIDHYNRSERVYRLLGCELTYHGNLPHAGETLRYDIHLDNHAKHGDVRLMFFHYDCHVGGRPQLSVREGQAGFFTDEELAESAGCLWTPEEQGIVADGRVDGPVVGDVPTQIDAETLRAFSERGAAAFGPEFGVALAHTRSPAVQSGDMLLMDRVTTIDPTGGPWGRGYLRGELTLDRDRLSDECWFYDGHFKNDPCMPGTLMFEGCLQAMSIYLAALGYTLRRDGWRFQPKPETPFPLSCRGQATPSSKLLTYELFVEEVHDGPIPTLYADVLCVVDGRKAFHGRRIALELVPDWPLEAMPALLEGIVDHEPVAVVDGFKFGYASMLAAAWGRPSDAFGPMYKPFDGPRPVARLPGPPYHFMSRVRSLDFVPGEMKPGAKVSIDYDIPDSAWYFDVNGAPTMPFAVLLEAALQPCGWLASAVGSALTVESELGFRNLDGTATLYRELLPTDGTLTTHVDLLSVSSTAGMIVQAFKVDCLVDGERVYDLHTVFGFFPPAALSNQAGLPVSAEQRALLERSSGFAVDLRIQPGPYWAASRPHLAAPMLLMLDRVTGYWPSGGEAQLGELRGEKDVDQDEWFFKAHFFQDPVQPGSLGIEALLQLLQFFMLEERMDDGIESPRFEPIALGTEHSWKYRGQVLLHNQTIESTIEITERGVDAGGAFAFANGSLWVDGKRIYEAKNLGMRIVAE